MIFSIGLDIGGTKIAGAVFDESGTVVAENTVPTPPDYGDFIEACSVLVREFDKACSAKANVGIGIAGVIDPAKGTVYTPNIPYLKNRIFRGDLEKRIDRPLRLANDADCAALAEALDGAGQGFHSVFGLIMGTGVGGGLVLDGKIFEGKHGFACEIGHLPLPFRDESDGPVVECGCGQKGCIDKTISGPALSRLYKAMTGQDADAVQIAKLMLENDAKALLVLDQFLTTVSKAMITVIHAYDPEIIVVSGGLSNLPRLYDEVPRRWTRYALSKTLTTKFKPSRHGIMSGVRGAAWLTHPMAAKGL